MNRHLRKCTSQRISRDSPAICYEFHRQYLQLAPLLKFNMTLNVSKCIILGECIFSHGISSKFEQV